MHSLSSQSDEIGKVVGVIREIAEQTNLLALNAAIESARAGEHGRGFAVVAGEVRRLAERTRDSTEEITRMVEQIQTRTHQAVESSSASNIQLQEALDKVTLVGDALQQIVQGAKDSEGLVSLIAAATTEQRAAALEISQGLSDVANGAAAESIAAESSSRSCGTLASLATELEHTVSEFRLQA
jgi:methyl-accepting chemotaxis protein